MDLFHAITQGIDSVLTCDWYDSFKVSSSSSNSSSRSGSAQSSPTHSRNGSLSESITTVDGRGSVTEHITRMASGTDQKLMDTERGGESTQYESIKTVTNPTEKERGQLGTGPSSSETSNASEERGQKTAENIRYGQNISESGVGGKTTSSDGSAQQAGGLGGKIDEADAQKDTRSQQNYGPGSNVGA